MVYDQVHVPLGQEFKTGPFRENHPKQGVHVFNTAFLSTPHRVTVKDVGTFFSVYAGFQRARITEFRSPGCKDGMEQKMEIGIQTVFKPIKDDSDGTGCASVHQEGKKQLFLTQIESEQYFFRIPRRMYGVHFGSPVYVVWVEQEKIAVHAPGKDFAVGDLCFVALTWPELRIAFQVDIPGCKDSLIDVGVDGTDGHIQFGMVCHDLIGRLSLINQMGYQLVFLNQFGLSHVYAVSGRGEGFLVFTVCKTSIVDILVCDGAFMNSLFTAIADIRSFIQAITAFADKVSASLVAGRTGGAFDATKDDLATNICLSTVISVDAEVVGIVESALVIPVAESVPFDLFRNGRGIFTEEACNVFKGSSGGKSFFNVKPILQGEMFLITRNKIAQDFSFYCSQKAEESYHKRMKK